MDAPLPSPRPPQRPLEDRWTPVLFVAALVFLLVVGVILHRHQKFDLTDGELHFELVVLAVLWPLFIAEAVFRFARRDRARGLRPALVEMVWVSLVPPLRLGVRSRAPRREFWYPRLGWRPVDRSLRKRLERVFSLPMIFIALMVLPLLAIEYGWPGKVAEERALAHFLKYAAAGIWLAFAFELIVMTAVAEKKLLFCLTHWVSLAVVLLPLVQFLPLVRALRLGRVLRLEQLTNMGRLYRLRGLWLRAWRAVLLLQLVQWLTSASPERRLQQMEEMLAAREEELTELRGEIAEMRRVVAERQETVAIPVAESGR